MTYAPLAPPLITGNASSDCRACVIIPARNEEQTLPRTLDALRLQQHLSGRPLAPEGYEIILLLNNCTDSSQLVAERYRARHPRLDLKIACSNFLPADAYVGTARRLLMDTAWHRLRTSPSPFVAILSTDADTVVAPDWISRNLAAIEAGADAVGGVIHLLDDDLEALKKDCPGTYLAYQRDRHLQRLVAELEANLDADRADPWPRHLEHFGASLACTPAIYAAAGGLPPVKHLEDAAFVDALRKVGARIRHCPDTRVFTSARLDGRAQVGLSGQLRLWRLQARNNEPHVVDSAEWIEHRFRSMAELRQLNVSISAPSVLQYPEPWQSRIAALHAERLPTPRFLELLDCDALIERLFTGPRTAEITQTIAALTAVISSLAHTAERAANNHPAMP